MTIKDVSAWLRLLKLDITDDMVSNEPWNDSKVPYMDVTLAWSGDKDDWTIQSGDNSFSGSAYHYRHWAVGTLQRRTNTRELARELIDEAYELYELATKGVPRLLMNTHELQKRVSEIEERVQSFIDSEIQPLLLPLLREAMIKCPDALEFCQGMGADWVKMRNGDDLNQTHYDHNYKSLRDDNAGEAFEMLFRALESLCGVDSWPIIKLPDGKELTRANVLGADNL